MKERKTLLITVATVCIYTAILVGWHLYVPRENLTIQVPGADNRPEGLARKANDVVIGEYFMRRSLLPDLRGNGLDLEGSVLIM